MQTIASLMSSMCQAKFHIWVLENANFFGASGGENLMESSIKTRLRGAIVPLNSAIKSLLNCYESVMIVL